MEYVGNIIRPPSEADSLILQVAVGCSYNKCTFCGIYKDTLFSIKSDRAIEGDLQFASQNCRNLKRVFLADGDVLAISQNSLVRIFQMIHHYLPWISRLALYGNARAIRGKSDENLQDLKDLGLDRIYMGLESGCDEVLRRIQKGESAKTMISAGEKVRRNGIFLSVTALLGLGGRALSQRHAVETAKVLSFMAPRQIALLTLMPLANTSLGRDVLAGAMHLPGPEGMLTELSTILFNLENVRCQFHANHASSYLPLAGRLPRDRGRLLANIESARTGQIPLVPEYRRAL